MSPINRASSGRDIEQHFPLPQDPLLYCGVEVAHRSEVNHTATNEGCQRCFHLAQVDERNPLAWAKTDKDVDVALWAEIGTQHRVEQRKFAHIVRDAELADGLLINPNRQGSPTGHRQPFLSRSL